MNTKLLTAALAAATLCLTAVPLATADPTDHLLNCPTEDDSTTFVLESPSDSGSDSTSASDQRDVWRVEIEAVGPMSGAEPGFLLSAEQTAGGPTDGSLTYFIYRQVALDRVKCVVVASGVMNPLAQTPIFVFPNEVVQDATYVEIEEVNRASGVSAAFTYDLVLDDIL